MSKSSEDTLGVRYTGWAALDRDPQDDAVEFVCPNCGRRGAKQAHHERAVYHFTDGFLQDLQGETASCRGCKVSLHIAPVVLVHDQDEKRRFDAIFSTDVNPN
jgi:hypothetical protein